MHGTWIDSIPCAVRLVQTSLKLRAPSSLAKLKTRKLARAGTVPRSRKIISKNSTIHVKWIVSHFPTAEDDRCGRRLFLGPNCDPNGFNMIPSTFRAKASSSEQMRHADDLIKLEKESRRKRRRGGVGWQNTAACAPAKDRCAIARGTCRLSTHCGTPLNRIQNTKWTEPPLKCGLGNYGSGNFAYARNTPQFAIVKMKLQTHTRHFDGRARLLRFLCSPPSP